MLPRDRAPRTLGRLAGELGLPGPETGADLLIEDVAPLDGAGPRDLAALYDTRRLADAVSSGAGALIVPEGAASRLRGRPLLVSPAPKADFARAIAILRPVRRPAPGIDPLARVAASAQVDPTATVGPLAVIGEEVVVGPRVVIGAGAVVLDGVEIGEETVVDPRVVIYPNTRIGRACRLLAGAVVGAPGFGHARDAAGRAVRVPHVGQVVLEDGVEIGANATVDRATFGQTVLRRGARIDNLVQIGHNAEVGEDAMIAAQSGLSGSSRLGRGVLVGGQSGLADHVAVGDGAIVAAKTAVFGDVEPGAAVAGIPAMPLSRWRRLAAIQARLPELWKTLLRRPGKPAEEDETT
ncbi:MAG: UDP-3-O-(3-hydroxymyristoyl)glucosamine N-acyltransferase [Acidobacteria bacterium]|nr:MAG: UDP-3-O-(3-hydroxymyristoyl)glucosamine N-acyltransferase [Acidobacteriota bacterium]